ncbi:MAG: hypothetical protein WA139_02180 [Candidatus Aenigmatarchaeota archaeon]
MPRGRKASRKVNEKTENCDCCGGKHNKIISIGLLLILLGFAARVGWNIADLFLLLGAIFVVKGLLLSTMKK